MKLSISVVAVLLGMLGSATLQDGVLAEAPTGPDRPQWRDVTFQPPSSQWQPVRDASSKSDQPHAFSRREGLHELELSLTSVEAPAALAPSEVASKYFNSQKQRTHTDGAVSDIKIGQRKIAGTDYPIFSERFTPTSGPPISDIAAILVFPTDYDQRQRWLVVQWSDTHSGTTGPNPLDELDSFVASIGVVPLGTVLLTDDFSDPLNGPLSDNGSSEHYDVSYSDGQFTLQKSAPDFDGVYAASIPGTYADSSLAVDTHVTQGGYGPLEFLWCRRSTDGSYRAAVDPSDGSAHLTRVMANTDQAELVAWTTSPAIKIGTASNHVELICQGSLIELDVNGTRVFSVRDTDLVEGGLSIGGGGFTDYDVVPEIRFANLVIAQR